MKDSRTQLARDAQNRKNWFESAKKLFAAARLLEPAIDDWWGKTRLWFEDKGPQPAIEYTSVYLMLTGLAVENLCKGYISERLDKHEKAKLEQGVLPARLDRKHKLSRMLDDVGFAPTNQEYEILTRIQEALHWRGRYPIPKDHLAIPQQHLTTGADCILVNRLIERLSKHVGSE